MYLCGAVTHSIVLTIWCIINSNNNEHNRNWSRNERGREIMKQNLEMSLLPSTHSIFVNWLMKLNECLRVYAWALICTFRENMPRKYHFTLGATIITTKINTDISGSGNFEFRCLVFGQFFPCKQTNCLQPRLIFRFEHCLYNGISSLLLTYTKYLLFICLFLLFLLLLRALCWVPQLANWRVFVCVCLCQFCWPNHSFKWRVWLNAHLPGSVSCKSR